MFSGCLISLYIKMAVGRECLGLAENFGEMKRWAYRKSTIKPPTGGGGAYLCQAHLRGGLNGDRGGFLIFERETGA